MDRTLGVDFRPGDDYTSELLLDCKPESIFAGSGISLSNPEGLPTWKEYVDGVLQALLKVALLETEKHPRRGRKAAYVETTLHQLTPVDTEVLEALVDSKHPLYQTTDQLIRRLGVEYLNVVEDAFSLEMQMFKENQQQRLRFAKPPDCSSIHSKLAEDLLDGHIQIILTTNFDNRLENALDHLRIKHHSKYRIVKFRLDEKPESEKEAEFKQRLLEAAEHLTTARDWIEAGRALNQVRSTVVIVPSWMEFRILVLAFPNFATTKLPFRFLLKVHGTANQPKTCVDNHLQRSQGLPAPVKFALWSMWSTTRVNTLGFSGAELNDNLDYFQMVSTLNFSPLNVRWTTRDLSKDENAVTRLEQMAINSPGSTFIRIKMCMEIDRGQNKLEKFNNRVQKWAEGLGDVWCAAALLDLFVAFDPWSTKPRDESKWANVFTRGWYRTRMAFNSESLRGLLWKKLEARISSNHNQGFPMPRYHPNYTTYHVSSLVAGCEQAVETRHAQTGGHVRFHHLRIAMETFIGMADLPSDTYNYDQLIHQGYYIIQRKLDELEELDPHSEFYGVNSDMWTYWAARCLLERFHGTRRELRIRMLECARVSASVTGNLAALDLLDHWIRRILQQGERARFNFPRIARSLYATPESGNSFVALAPPNNLPDTHIHLIDMDLWAPSIYLQDIPYGDFLRAMLTYALLLKPRIIATQNIFNSRTLVMEVLCPVNNLTKRHEVNETFVERIDVWTTEVPQNINKWATEVRERYEEIARDKPFLLDAIPDEALQPILQYYDRHREQRVPVEYRETAERFEADLQVLLRTDVIEQARNVLGQSHCPWLRLPDDDDPDDGRTLVKEFREEAQRLLSAVQQKLGDGERFYRADAYALLNIASLPTSLQATGRNDQPPEVQTDVRNKWLAHVALKSIVDAAYNLNLATHHKVDILTSDPSRHLLQLALLVGGKGDYADTHSRSVALSNGPFQPHVVNKQALTSFAALRALNAADMGRLRRAWVDHKTGPLDETDFHKIRTTYLPNRPSDIMWRYEFPQEADSYRHFIQTGPEGKKEREWFKFIALRILQELNFPHSEPVPALYTLPKFTWGEYYYKHVDEPGV